MPPHARDYPPKILRTSTAAFNQTVEHKVTLDELDGYNSPDEFSTAEDIRIRMASERKSETTLPVTFNLGLGLALDDNMMVTTVSTEGPAAKQATLADDKTHAPIRKGDKLVGVNDKLFDSSRSARAQLEEFVTQSNRQGRELVINFNAVPIPVLKREVPPEPRGEATPVRDFFFFLIFLAVGVCLPAILLSLYGEEKAPVPYSECVAAYEPIMKNLVALNSSANSSETADLLETLVGKKICVDKTNPATYLVPYCNLTDAESVAQYMGWGEVLPSVVILIFIAFLLPKMREYCFRPDPRKSIFDKLIAKIMDEAEWEEPESDFERELNDALMETKAELQSELPGIQQAVQQLEKRKDAKSKTIQDLSTAVLSLCSDGILFASIFAGIYWGYSAEKGSKIALDNHNGNCWFMQTAAFPFTVPLIIPIVKLIVKGYDRTAYVVKAGGQDGAKKKKVTSLSTTYFKLEAEIEKYREEAGNEAPALIKMVPVTAIDLIIFAYARVAEKTRFLPSLPSFVMGKTRYSAEYKPPSKAPAQNGHKTNDILAWITDKQNKMPSRSHGVHQCFKLMQRWERRLLMFITGLWGLVLSIYVLPLFIVFILGALFPTLLNQLVFAVYAALVLYSVVILAEMLFETTYQLIKCREMSIVEDKFYIRDKFFRSRPLYLLTPVIGILVLLLLVPPIIMMGRFYFKPLNEPNQKYKSVSSLLMEFNDMLWAWKTLFNVSFPFPDLENFFRIDFWNGIKNLRDMSFVLGILAVITDFFADFGLPLFFDGFRFTFNCVSASEATKSVAELNSTRKKFLKAKKNIRVLALFAQKLRDDANKGRSKAKKGANKPSVKFDAVQNELEK